MSQSSPPRNESRLKEHEAAVRRDLALTDYPARDWVRSRQTSRGEKVLDVLIIGGGQSGLAVAFGLMREKVTNILVIDENDEGLAGPWLTFARMHTLRTPKHLTGPDLGIPSLTPRAWYEALFGQESWQDLGLLPKELWAEYINWYRSLLGIPVKHRTRAGAIEWSAEERSFIVPVEADGRPGQLHARKIVLATGIDGCGRWEIPPVISRNLPQSLYAHTRDEIDFRALRDKRIAVLGAGASAFDNASVALETGAREVHLFFRREDLPNVNPYRWAEFVGFLKHHADLADDLKYKFIAQIIRMGQLPPTDTFERATRFNNFHLHAGSPWLDVESRGQVAAIATPKTRFEVDFIIIGTGFVTDLNLRPELAKLVDRIAIWKDRYQPEESEKSDDLLRHPYLGPHFQFQERVAGDAPYLESLFCYTFGCLLSLGFGGASISGMKYSVPRIVAGITGQLYAEDAQHYLDSLKAWDLREF